jgi:hypothetical protein
MRLLVQAAAPPCPSCIHFCPYVFNCCWCPPPFPKGAAVATLLLLLDNCCPLPQLLLCELLTCGGMAFLG